MGFEDDMIEYGFSDGNDYIDHLMDEAESIMQQNAERERQANRCEVWLESHTDEEIYLMEEDARRKKLEEERSERKKRQKLLNEERILKAWANDNPQKALTWFAFYKSSPNVRKANLDNFLLDMGVSAICDRRNVGCLWTGYDEWKSWLEKSEAFQEFKEKAPKEYQQLKNDKYGDYVERVVFKYLRYRDASFSDEESFFISCLSSNRISYALPKILNEWINDHHELWNEISLKYITELKTENEYLFQSWLENHRWRDEFAVWREKNPFLWQTFKTNCDNGQALQEGDLRAAWLDEFKKKWDQTYIDLWKEYYNSHKEFLWYAYTEIQWVNYSIKKEAVECKPKKKIIKRKRRRFSDSSFFNSICDYKNKDDFSNWDGPKYSVLESGDPRYRFRCETYEDEDLIHDILIAEYRKGLNDNLEKKLFIEQYCSEIEFDRFINRSKTFFCRACNRYKKIEENPEDYANRKVMELWRSQNKKQWEKWNYYYCWSVLYGKCNCSLVEHYDIWRRLNPSKWNKWESGKYVSWKRNAQNIDLWIRWLLDNNQLNFHEWAYKKHIKGWNRHINKEMEHDLQWSYNTLFKSYLSTRFGEWKRTNYKNWRYWGNALKEQIMIDKFLHECISGDIILAPYEPEYKLHIQIQEKLYRHKIGMNIFCENFAVIENDGSYGYINKNGDIVIKPQYDDALPFLNGIALVKTHSYDYNEYVSELGYSIRNKIGGKWGGIDKQGIMVIEPQFDEIRFVDDMVLFSKGGVLDTNERVPKLKESKWGLMDASFHEIIPAKYDLLVLLDNGLFKARKRVNNEDKWALLSNVGVEKTEFKYNHIFITDEYDSSGRNLLLANIGGQFDYDDCGVPRSHGGGCYNGYWGYLDMDGNEIEQFISANNIFDFWDKYSELHDCSDGYGINDTSKNLH